MSTLLSVNLNKIALLRNSRGRNYPNLVQTAQKILEMGVKGLTIHPRSDERHIKYTDAGELKQLVDAYSDVELNIEGYPSGKFIDLLREVRPHQCTLVPDSDNQLTSDHGYDLRKHGENLSETISQLKPLGIRCAVFMDPIALDMKLARDVGMDGVELYTEEWASYFASDQMPVVAEKYRNSIHGASKLSLRVNAGHDLNLQNLEKFLQLGPVSEVSIGHALTVEALDYGLKETISRYLKICK